MEIYPLLLKSVYKEYLWGGNRIARKYGREDAPKLCAESWEVTDRPEGMSVVLNGSLKGATLHELVQKMGADLLGRGVDADRFPLLIKIIDAKKDLSVQVHPNDDNAHLTGGEAKTEMWYVLDADANAKIYAGMKPGVTRQKFEAALNNKRLEQDVLAAVPAKTGRTVFVPGGRLHAIGAGCLLLEVQQNSNTTYRVYDWDRVGADGKPRELHLEKALQVIDWDHPMPEVVPPKLIESDHLNQHWQILDSPFFKLQRFDLSEPRDINHDGASFQILFVLRGTTLIGANGIMAACAPGTSCLIPAAAHDYTITPIKGSASIMLITM